MKIKRPISIFAKCILLMHLLLLQENENKYLLTALIKVCRFLQSRDIAIRTTHVHVSMYSMRKLRKLVYKCVIIAADFTSQICYSVHVLCIVEIIKPYIKSLSHSSVSSVVFFLKAENKVERARDAREAAFCWWVDTEPVVWSSEGLFQVSGSSLAPIAAMWWLCRSTAWLKAF